MRRLVAIAVVLVALAVPAWAQKPTAAAAVTVAILYFDYEGKDEELAYLRKGLTEMLVTDLSGTSGIALVEREQLEKVIRELELNQSNRIDRSTANKLGKLLGAKYIVLGRYFTFRGTLQVNAKVVSVERGTAVGVGARGVVDEFLGIEEELVKKLRAELVKLGSKSGTTPSPSRKHKRLSKQLATRTAASYGRALDAIDRGDKKVARTLLQKVVAEQPDFRLATRDLLALTR